MNIIVKTLNGKLIHLDINIDTTMDDIKNMIQDMEGIQTDNLNIYYKNKIYNDIQTINECNYEQGTVISITPKLRQ